MRKKLARVSIIDYGMGNIQSVRNALEFLGVEPVVVNDIKDIDIGRKTIIPGVGAFGDAMKNIQPPMLGICLGMQLFFETSEESDDEKGIAALEGKVVKPNTSQKLPQIGWNSLDIRKKNCPLFDGIENGYVYYAHSFHVDPDEDVIAATSDYGEEITASVWKDNIFGTQFHPEKSGKVGLKILKNFLRL